MKTETKDLLKRIIRDAYYTNNLNWLYDEEFEELSKEFDIEL